MKRAAMAVGISGTVAELIDRQGGKVGRRTERIKRHHARQRPWGRLARADLQALSKGVSASQGCRRPGFVGGAVLETSDSGRHGGRNDSANSDSA